MVRRLKYYQSEQPGRERWLVSYTDVITILLILFAAAAAQAIHGHPPPPPASPPPAEPREALIRARERLGKAGLDLKLEKRGLIVSLPQAILFASGEDRVMPEAFPVLDQIADVLAGLPNKIALVGHADAVPIHNRRFGSNWELSAARSLRLLELLAARYGIDESRLSVQSYGSYSPKGPNDSADGRAENRRVEILILDDAGG